MNELDYDSQPKMCKNCGRIIPYSKRQNTFCNKSCSATFNNKGIVRNGRKVNQKECKNCGVKFKPHGSNKGKFCCKKCQGEYSWKRTKAKIEKLGWHKTRNSFTVRKYLKEVRGCKCEICNRTKWEGKEIPLVLDHINGDPTDDRMVNLRLVCGNCDMQLPTYKSKNNGMGRRYRREQYAKDK